MQPELNRTKRRPQSIKKKRKKRLFFTITLFAFLFASVAAGAVWWKIDRFFGVIKEPGSVSANNVYEPDKPISTVIIGKDSRGGLG